MLTANFNLLRKSHLAKRFHHNILIYIFIIFYLDMYDLALFAGYAIYLARIFLPQYDIYQCLLIFSVVFLLTQFIKFFGFIYYFTSNKGNGFFKYSIVLLLISHFLLIVFPTYHEFGLTSFLLFLIFRLLFGFTLGCEIGSAIKLTNDLSIHDSSADLYYFLWLSGEVGIFVSMLVNRIIVLKYFDSINYLHSWRIQFAINSCLIVYCVYIKFFKNISSIKNNFSRVSFIHLVKNDWQYILVRAITFFYSALLILTIVIRVPRNMELIFGLQPSQINRELIIISILGFLGANSVTLIKKVISAYNFMLILFVISCILQFRVWERIYFIDWSTYTIYIYCMAFLYGAFLRVTPDVLNKSVNFNSRTHIIGRFISYMISYAILTSLAEFLFDYSHYKERNIHDSLAIIVMILFSVLGLVSLLIFKRNYE